MAHEHSIYEAIYLKIENGYENCESADYEMSKPNYRANITAYEPI